MSVVEFPASGLSACHVNALLGHFYPAIRSGWIGGCRSIRTDREGTALLIVDRHEQPLFSIGREKGWFYVLEAERLHVIARRRSFRQLLDDLPRMAPRSAGNSARV